MTIEQIIYEYNAGLISATEAMERVTEETYGNVAYSAHTQYGRQIQLDLPEEKS